MGMAADRNAAAGRAGIDIDIFSVMNDEDFDRADFDDGGFGKFSRPGAAIVVAANGDDLGDGLQSADHLRLADIAGVNDQIYARERAERLGPDQTVSIRNYSNHPDSHLWALHHLTI